MTKRIWHKRFRRAVLAACQCLVLTGIGAAWAQTHPDRGDIWNMEMLRRPPAVRDADGFDEDHIRAVFYDGLPFHGKPTRVFAWIGVPERTDNRKVPGIVLVHGGGGTAFAEWIRLWTARGYAAIAMDTCGCVPKGSYGKWQRHEAGGPPGWGGFDRIDEPTGDQWTYHAVADIVLAHSLLASMPEVDRDRIGITGISWGGYLTCIAAGVDERFKFAVPVYGCGFLGDNSTWLGTFQKMGSEKSRKWLKLWDPSTYLASAKMPMLWVTGTNDFAYPMDSLQKSYRLSAAQSRLAIRIRMPHGHGGAGENPKEIHAFANSIVKNTAPLPTFGDQGIKANRALADFVSQRPIRKAELNYTCDDGPWQKRLWKTLDACIDSENSRLKATLPEGTKVYYFNLIDEAGLVISSEHIELE